MNHECKIQIDHGDASIAISITRVCFLKKQSFLKSKEKVGFGVQSEHSSSGVPSWFDEQLVSVIASLTVTMAKLNEKLLHAVISEEGSLPTLYCPLQAQTI